MNDPLVPAPPVVPTQKTGSEPVIGGNGEPKGTLLDFWRWAFSQTLDNALRGILAEYLVGLALDALGDGVRVEWDAFDLVTSNGIKVEVKSAAYLQSWRQSTYSRPSFGVREATSWSANTNAWDGHQARCADVYVFCLFTARDRATADPLDTRQWEFFVASTKRLNEVLGVQKTITLASLMRRVEPAKVTFESLADAVQKAAQNR